MKKMSLMIALLLSVMVPILGQHAHEHVVSGVVVFDDGEAMVGAYLLLESADTTYSGVSDNAGEFEIERVEAGDYTMKVSYIGMADYVKPMTVTADMEALTIELKPGAAQLNEVTVTTQKRSQNLTDVPITIAAINSTMLKQFHITQLDVLSNYVPGLQVQIQSPNNPGFVIRGVTSDNGDSRVQQRVSIFQDGVSISKARGSAVEIFDMERIEVAKGPQGTLFGRSAENGAINLISNKPENKVSGELAIGYGYYNEKILNGYLNTPVVDGKLLNRFAFSYNDREGFIDNVSGGTLNGKNALALRDIVRFLPDDKTTIDLMFNYEHNDTPGTSFKSGTYAPLGGDLDPNSSADLDGGEELYIKRDVFSVSLPITRILSDTWTFNSLTAYRYFDTDEAFDADGTAAHALFFHEYENDDQFSQEFRFNFDDENDKLSGFIGGSYFYEKGYQKITFNTNPQDFYTLLTPVIANSYGAELSGLSDAITMLGTAGYLGAEESQYFLSQVPSAQPLVIGGIPNSTLNMPNLAPLLPYIGASLPASMQQLLALFDGSELPSSYDEEYTNYNTTSSIELFADVTYKLTQKLALTAGIRGTYEHQIGGFSSAHTGDASVLGLLSGYYPNVLSWNTDGQKNTASKDYWSAVGRLALNYKFYNSSVYASVSRGRRPGVIDIGTTAADSTTYLQPEVIWNYEVGMKGMVFANRLKYELAAYYYDWSHFQSSQLNQETLQFIATDAGQAHSFGVEAGLQYALPQGSSIFANYGYINGQFDDEGEDGEAQEYAGNTFRLTPEHSLSAGLNVVMPISARAYAYVRPSYTYKSKVYFEDDNTEALSQEAYGLANVDAGVSLSAGKLLYDFSLYGKNVLDEQYIIDGGNTGNLFGIPTFVGGSRATYGAVVRVKF